MAHKPDSKWGLSIKVRLVIIAMMLIAVNLVFYLHFGSSIVSDTDDFNLSIVTNITSNLEVMMHLSLL